MTEEERMAALEALINAALCWWCDHRAADHFAHQGPCAECWRLLRAADGDRQICGKTLCERFIVRLETSAALEALDRISA